MPGRVLELLHAATPDTPDADLLARFVATRDEGAFADLVRAHGPAVYRVCRRLAPRHADDAFQATFLVLACRAGAVRKASSVGSWLIGAAGRVARQMTRRERRSADVCATLARPDDRNSGAAELSATLDDELSRLPDRLRAPLVSCFLYGRTQEQAATELDVSVRTLRRRLERAKALLRLRLERRGVVPAVAVALVAGVGPAPAVPTELVRRTVRAALEFPNGGAVGPAALAAKGVVNHMARLKASGLVAAAAVLIGLGASAARQEPAPPPDTPVFPLAVPALGERPLKLDIAFPSMADRPTGERPGHVHRSANFLVTAPTAVSARAVAAEAEFQRQQIGRLWLGKEPPPWAVRCEIVVRGAPDRATGATTFDFHTDPNGRPVCRGAKMELTGPLEGVLSTALPPEVTHAVLAHHFGKPLPRWAGAGLAVMSLGDEEQVQQDQKCRELLNAGKGIRLRILFRKTEYPRDAMVLVAQGHSIVRFLLASEPAPGKAHRALLEFLRVGAEENTAESWNKAAKDVYRFDSVDALETAWLATLRKPPSAPKAPTPDDEEPGLIPPTRLPEARPVQKDETVVVNTRKFKLPVQIAPERRTADRAVTLFVSRGKEPWYQAGMITPDKTAFTFEAPEDGLYWLAVAVIPKDQPDSSVTALEPALKVIVDTVPPVVRVTKAERVDDRLRVSWSVTEANPGALKVRWNVTGRESDWHDVPVATNESSATFSPGSGAKAQIQVVQVDAAGNEGRSAVVTVE
ncbi:sigma-70 family rna polymerase sigma factor : Uncharacterized protein OS=Isosphaera pallida (strain ATCC 43644 / DSM 9630 / IS1B) GN=Isop_0849 PE=4 SV=1: Sigma70_r2: Sigma70_r4_2 [Gemmata massiliana]|uniref:RNA polymerase sigma-70 region 2 domain-containing protein n=1 Tax=Gemmata massiliana TaxID=1210884 RepID=A0A6P2CZK0_9BACT|nr:sigma-70 family RNA polymerase sigma factor [Gemmata massiliana]VTR93555.1 sigma-70 family rna polymerase sigma factor : Uncharacterized protein OS=Isosphaera pallida (strain ATCC 43644 / DSM 9630 / IS1B) GN=Isop_0849 PE=4 SV=1: Sigma70_r2: Sigma70_r4_2 [Gemmata massiliana]